MEWRDMARGGFIPTLPGLLLGFLAGLDGWWEGFQWGLLAVHAAPASAPVGHKHTTTTVSLTPGSVGRNS